MMNITFLTEGETLMLYSSCGKCRSQNPEIIAMHEAHCVTCKPIPAAQPVMKARNNRLEKQ